MPRREASIDREPSSGGPTHPRPQFARELWLSLDGEWDFSFSRTHDPAEVTWERKIRVPFAPEAPLSGIGDEGYHPVAWYRRRLDVPPEWAGQRVLLHFGAVDYRARVWLGEHLVAEHEGGHTPFLADIPAGVGAGARELVVRVEDDPHEMDKPRGKQDWRPEPHAIWYPRTTGIWQSVWLEPVPPVHLSRARFTPDVAAFGIAVEVAVEAPSGAGGGGPDGSALDGVEVDVTLSVEGRTLARDAWSLAGAASGGRTAGRRIDLPDPGIDDARAAFLWSPERPTLIDVELRLRRGDETLDEVRSYTALRSVGTRDGRFLLNDRPYFLRLVLDQGYWRDGLMTAPDDAALRRDVELTKALGFNGVRKHQKIEDPRYLYWADRLGLLVWQEMPSAYAFTSRTLPRLTREWLEVLERDHNHPCVAAWVCFNESWGVPDLPRDARQRDAVRALHALTRALDPTRPVVGNDGWEFVAGDLFTIHDYTDDPAALRARYESPAAVERALAELRPGGRALRAEGAGIGGRPVVLSEFGGIRFSREEEGWGYSQVDSPDALLAAYRDLVAAASGAGLAGFCYTQLTDTFQEQNGLLTMDRAPKAALADLARATKGEPG